MISVGDLVLWKKRDVISDLPGLALRKEAMGKNIGFWILWPDDRIAWSPSSLLKTVRNTSHGKYETTSTPT